MSKLSENGKIQLQNLIDKFDERTAANKLIDLALKKKVGLTSSDLPDTATFANGLDGVQSHLEDQDFDAAWECAVDVANEMLEDEGYGDMYESKNKKTIKENLNLKELKEMIVRIVLEEKSLLKRKKINEGYYFGDPNDNDDYDSESNGKQYNDDDDYVLVYNLLDKFPNVNERDMFDAVRSVWDYTKPQKENIQALTDYLKPNNNYFNHGKVSEAKKDSKKQRKFNKVMGEFGDGTLKTSAGKKVTDRKQAIAIAYSESGLDENVNEDYDYAIDNDFQDDNQSSELNKHSGLGVFEYVDWRVLFDNLKSNYDLIINKKNYNQAYPISDFLDSMSKEQLEVLEDANLIEILDGFPIISDYSIPYNNFYTLAKKAWKDNNGQVLNEGVARNIPKIEKYVNQINDLISQAYDSDGDPIGVVDPTSTWEEPYIYEPIVYKNGALKIVSRSNYQPGKVNTDIVRSSDMEYEGIPTLQLLSRMYKKALKNKNKGL